ncbi:hypothetical protein Dimus_030490 [Dionaea muscipula]
MLTFYPFLPRCCPSAIGGAGITYLSRSQHPIASENSQLSYQLNESYGTVQLMHYFCRSFASASSSQPPDKNETEVWNYIALLYLNEFFYAR